MLALLKPSAETIPQLDSLVWDHRRYLHSAPFARLPHLYHLQDRLVLESIPVSGILYWTILARRLVPPYGKLQ